MFPEPFLKRLKEQTYIDADSLISSLSEQSPASIRINPAKWDKTPVASSPVPWCENGYYLGVRPSFTLDPLFHCGSYYPQEASGMFLGEAVRQLIMESEELRILDLCGAPGGKTTHLSTVIGSRGVIIANEAIRTRASVLAENVTKWGTGNIMVTNSDPSSFSSLAGYFDLIVVDAPCSGEGMFRDAVAREEWSAANTALCSDRQQRILHDVWPSLKQGGYLIYSTCTFNPAENEENVKWLSEKYDATSFPLDISKYDGVKEIAWKGITGYGFHPGRIRGEGFFISVLQKNNNVPGSESPFTKKSSSQVTGNELKTAERISCTPSDRLYLNNDIVWSLSVPVAEFVFLRQSLKIIKGGTQLIRMRGTGFTPVHDLSLSVLLREDAFPVFDLEYNHAISYLKKENVILPGMPAGWIIISYRNVKLGFVKNLGSRVNNYYPVEWRIKMAGEASTAGLIISWES